MPLNLSYLTATSTIRARPKNLLTKKPSLTQYYHTHQAFKMRVPYISDPVPESFTQEERDIAARIAARRHPRPLTPLDLALLHSPPIANGWNTLLGAVRTQTTLPEDIRELAICRVAVVNRAWFEWGHHAPLAVGAGVDEKGMEAVKKEGALTLADKPEAFSEKQWAAIVLTDESTRNVEVKDETFAKVKELFGEKGAVELVATVATYNCVSRFLVALDGKSPLLFALDLCALKHRLC